MIRRLALGVLLIALASAALLVSDRGRRKPGPAATARRVAIFEHASQPALDSGAEGMIDGLA